MEIIKRKDGSVSGYREKVYIDGKSFTKSFKRKTDAKAWKRKTEGEKDLQEALGISTNLTVTFGEFVQNWLQGKVDQELSRRTIDAYRGVVDNYFSVFNLKLLKNITILDSQNLLSRISKSSLSVSRKNYILMVLKMILKDALKWGYILKNPLEVLPFLKVKEKEEKYWLPREIEKFLEANKDNSYYQLFLLALNTGMRCGELLGLCWDRVDFERRQILITRTRDRYELKDTTKTGVNRAIPMNNIVYDTLLNMNQNKRHPSFVLTDAKGNSLNGSHISERHLARAIKHAGVKKITFHNLRSTYASNFCMQGGDIFALSKILGHTSVDMTAKKYAHLHPTYLREAAQIIQFGNHETPDFSRHENPKFGTDDKAESALKLLKVEREDGPILRLV
jgi:integrase